MMIDKLQRFLVLFLFLFCFASKVKAQFEPIIEVIDKADNKEKRRIFLSFIESHGELPNIDIDSYYKAVEKYAKSTNNEQLLKDLEYQLTKNRRVFSKPKSAWKLEFDKLIQEYHQKKEWYYEGGCYHELSQYHFQREEYEQAFQNASIALALFKKIGYENTPLIGKVLHEIALNYYFFKDYQKVIELMRTSIALPAYTKGLDMQRYNNLAMAYLHTNRIDSAKYFLHKTADLAREYKSNSWISIVSGTLGDIHYDEGDYQKALAYYQTQVESSEGKGQIVSIIRLDAYVNLAKVYLSLDVIEPARKIIRRTDDSLRQESIGFLGDIQQKENLNKEHFSNKMNYAIKTGDYKNALQYKDSMNTIIKSISEKYNTLQIELATNKLLIRENQFQAVEAQYKKFRQSVAFVFITITLISLLGVVFFRLYRSRMAKKKQHERLLAMHKIASLERLQALSELEESRRQLKQFVQKINQQNELVQEFEQNLQKLREAHQEGTKDIEETLENLKNIRILTEDDWIEFKQNFGKAYPELFYNLKKYSPALTSSEKRYLMLASLSLSNKEMANALGVSGATIRVTRSRVRKKIDHLPEEITPRNIKDALAQSNLITS